MPKRLLYLLWAVLSLQTVAAQTVEEELYYPYAEAEERLMPPMADYTLFYQAIRSADDLYASIAAFQLPQITIKRRGEGYEHETISLGGVPIRYRHTTILRLLGVEERYLAGIGMEEGTIGSVGGHRRFLLTDAEPLQPFRIAARYAERGYRVGVQGSYNKALNDRWQLAAAADYRTGRDARIEGVFTDALHLGLRLTRQSERGHSLSFVASLPYSMRGLRSASTEEAFTLTDDPYYNPAWGLQAGKVRNARVRREFRPLLLVGGRMRLSDRSTLQLTGRGEFLVQKQSGLGWYDARTPQADNYRNMPSYADDPANEEAWRRADPRYTQVAWDELIAQNRLNGGAAHYALEDRVTQHVNGLLRAGIQTQTAAWQLSYGFTMAYRSSRNYKQMRDLLGADYLLDVDHYLMDDDTYANRQENDLRHPSRRIGRNDRFGYDYALNRSDASLWMQAAHRSERWQLLVAAELFRSTLYRRGFYEKELFPAAQSFGRSRRIERSPYTLKGEIGYSFSARRHVTLSLAVGAELPDEEQLFIQPLYNNRTVLHPALERYSAVQLTWYGTADRFDWQVAAFATLRNDGVQSRSYYDDVAAAYCNATISELTATMMGLEAAIEGRLNNHWSVAATVAWGSYRYTDDPSVRVVTDADNRVVEEQAVSHVKDCHIGGAPAWTATASLRYYGERGWGFRLSAGFAADRWVDPTFVRRTDRVARQSGATAEQIAAFTRQERLKDAFSLDLMLHKSIRFERSQLQLTLMARNLLDGRYPNYGYESMRSQRAGSSVSSYRIPQANRYIYAPPRSVMLTIGYRF